jgi:outer membrane protein assembly factor BamD (BamD/ComL family)
MNKHRFPTLFAIAAVLGLLFACSSVPDEIPEDLTPLEYFQRAQEASDAGRYTLSMEYYQKFQERFPEERDRNVWAEYEIALLYYKMEDYQTALQRFDSLLARYEAGEVPELPEGPRILAEKVKARIERILAEQDSR